VEGRREGRTGVFRYLDHALQRMDESCSSCHLCWGQRDVSLEGQEHNVEGGREAGRVGRREGLIYIL